jgi:HAD superfamily hydrolase (TIGR01450 family)
VEIRGKIEAVVFDMDGVLWRDYQGIPNAADAVARARATGRAVCFLTNNASRDRHFYHERLRDIGVDAACDDIYTSSNIAARHIFSTYSSRHRCLTLGGGPWLLDELRHVGLVAEPLEACTADWPDDAKSLLVISFYPEFGLGDVCRLLEIAANLAGIFATDRDGWHSTRRGPRPSSAWIVAAIEETLGMPVTTVGKPNAIALRTVADSLSVDVASILMVGDSRSADIAAARNAGARSCHFQDPEAYSNYSRFDRGPDPDFVIHDLRDLERLLDSTA